MPSKKATTAAVKEGKAAMVAAAAAGMGVKAATAFAPNKIHATSPVKASKSTAAAAAAAAAVSVEPQFLPLATSSVAKFYADIAVHQRREGRLTFELRTDAPSAIAGTTPLTARTTRAWHGHRGSTDTKLASLTSLRDVLSCMHCCADRFRVMFAGVGEDSVMRGASFHMPPSSAANSCTVTRSFTPMGHNVTPPAAETEPDTDSDSEGTSPQPRICSEPLSPLSPLSPLAGDTNLAAMPAVSEQPNVLDVYLNSKQQAASFPLCFLDTRSGAWLDEQGRPFATVVHQSHTEHLLQAMVSGASLRVPGRCPLPSDDDSQAGAWVSVQRCGTVVQATQWKPSPKWNRLYLLESAAFVLAVLYAHALLLPLWAAQCLWALYAVLVVAFARYMLSTLDDVREAAATSKPKRFVLTGGMVHSHSDDEPGCSNFYMNAPMTPMKAWFYFVNVTLNMLINNIAHVPRFAYGLVHSLWNYGTLRPACAASNYHWAMNTSLHRWMAPDGNLHYADVHVLVRDPSLFTHWTQRFLGHWRGNQLMRFNVEIVLNHQSLQLAEIRLISVEGTSVSTPVLVLTDPSECIAFMLFLAAGYSHPTVHIAAAHVNSCEATWPLAAKAHAAVNGLGHGAVNTVWPLLADTHAIHCAMLYGNSRAAIPHVRSGRVHELLMSQSATYRMVLRAHHEPLLSAAAANDPMGMAAVAQGSLMHGVDHLLVDCYTPFWSTVPQLGGVSFALVATFGGAHNFDFLSNFGSTPDELTRRLAQIVREEAEELAEGYQWAVCE